MDPKSLPKGSGSAFPTWGDAGDHIADGMTLRDYFAAKAMQGFCAYGALSNPDHGHTIEDVAQDAYEAADAMIKARESA
jgi:hypothetical protein